ncbi:hypothetical protein [Marinobacter halophilus]|nr:hypothetical protein [Marinobacter halophilus]
MDSNQLRVTQQNSVLPQPGLQAGATKLSLSWQATAAMTSLGVHGDNVNGNADGNGPVNAKIEAMQNALEKMNEIRKKQQEFIDASQGHIKKKSPMDDYFNIIDRLRLHLLNSQDEKKQAASRYLEFAKL